MKALEKAIKLLAIKYYSASELQQKLRQKGFSDEEIKDAIKRLERYGYLDDEKFAQNFVESKIKQKPIGKKLVKQKLKQKKIPDKIIEKAVSAIKEEELIEVALEKRLQQKGCPKNQKEVKNLYNYLLRRGFSGDIIMEMLRKADIFKLTD
ncbi:MAG: recombination regulator RecX [Pyrinomonadaceae bacterium]|nr:recombination regulator RecX [Pyrinomonadaceae bacterium]MCX7640394.1 recombination regulator RecX [Pyrinomonadaceae bacterium]MDW8304822.1 regulatory protein RecX [Acidobacteriota bacterium]